MFNNDAQSVLTRLNFEDFLWITFAILSFINIFGNYNEKEYLKTNRKEFDIKSSKIFGFTLSVALLIYIYFFIRNFNAYKNASKEEKSLYAKKLLGSSFLIAGVICLIYFQINETSFIGSPSI